MEQQRAAEAAGHEYLEHDERVDGVSKINEEHFEMATSEARCSLSGAQRRGTILLGWSRDGSFSLLPTGGAGGLAIRYAQKVAWRETAGDRL